MTARIELRTAHGIRSVDLIDDDGTHLDSWEPRGGEPSRAIAMAMLADIESLRGRPCPHVATSGEGTGYCTLAETQSRRAAVAESIWQRRSDGWHPVMHELIQAPCWLNERGDQEDLTPDQVAWIRGEPVPGEAADIHP